MPSSPFDPRDRKMVALGFRTRRSQEIAEFYETGAGNLPIPKFLGLPAAWADEVIAKITRRRE